MTPEEIRNLRKKRGETVRQFAAKLAVDKGTVVNWEQGYTHPKGLYLKTLQRMAKRAMRGKWDKPTGLRGGLTEDPASSWPQVTRIDKHTLDALCRVLECQPGDLLEYDEGEE